LKESSIEKASDVATHHIVDILKERINKFWD